MSFQYNCNHFEPYTHYGYPSWMAPAPPGCLQDPVSRSQTTQDHPSPPQPSANEGGPVLVGSSPTAEAANIYTVVLKVLSPQNKRDYQKHSLRNINPKTVSTPGELKEEISMQVGEAVSRLLEFPVGFYQESKKMWIQNKQDLHDAWKLLEKNKSLTLWCLGQDSRKKKGLRG